MTQTTEIEHLLAWCRVNNATINYLPDGGVFVFARVGSRSACANSTTLRGAITACQADYARLNCESGTFFIGGKL